MSEKNLEALFLHNLKDIYFAEQQIAAAMPEMIKAAESEELRAAFETHARETQDQIRRLEQIFAIMGQTPEAAPCEGILGILKEGQSTMAAFAGGEALEAGLIAAAQSIEHYEIARYGTLRAWARQLGLSEVSELVERSLDEETDTDELLSEIAETAINPEAV
ncbi:MAG TPA: ferritin-like domain-containing protein [Microvirga sp.]|jgi:ferritin-like metal-binding protein YciE|nr:ferritin-like domain-containing protein [Microvirga sp.]